MAIAPLPRVVVDRIAAGEVIDSLAAAVRELAENAIDAQATRIVITLDPDTLSLEVSDNGVGIAANDLPAIAQFHSTSKIGSLEDLCHVQTLGFRGEALHGLACLSRLRVASRTAGSDCGWEVSLPTGSPPRPRAMAVGTTITVGELFANLPARRDGLPSVPQQLRHVQRTLHLLAIAHPTLSWQATVHRHPWLTLAPSQNLRELLPQVLPRLDPQGLRHSQTPQIEVLLGVPSVVSRPRPDWIQVVLNGRAIAHPDLEQTILDCFRRTLPRHRFPLCVVRLNVPAHEIDWNRHPAKHEVYLHRLTHWQEQIQSQLQQMLHPEPQPSGRSHHLLRLAEQSQNYQASSSPPPVRVRSQLLNTYILVEHSGGIWLVEQHVAHERVLFEELERHWQLLPCDPPIAVTLTPAAADNLLALGLDLESFGVQTWLVRSLPQPWLDPLLQEHLPEFLTELSTLTDLSLAQAQIACRSAIKNGTPLDGEVMHRLIHQWQQTRNPHTCPHGRPICLPLETNDLARYFRRPWLAG
ncbi:MAG: DNA mismatch repair endonuclease MutL [Oscillatoriales cyanobacterium SM2_2_1]|nr:DNA mismatch repair endonuclease MutL [Oscillatoriales cyanobacterium SM2_2_1]